MFGDSQLRKRLGHLFSIDTDRFDELVAAAGLDPKTDLVGADFREADFSGSIMDGWNLSGCDLTGASFVGAKIRDLITKDTIGLNLNGAVFIDDAAVTDLHQASDNVERIIEQIRKAKTGAARGPLIETLLTGHGADERAWSFLLTYHLPRERVGRLVSMIIGAWESRQEYPKSAGNKLRFQLLRPDGNPYITVRARLIRELASRFGPTDELFEVCRAAIEKEGYFTSGSVAISILGESFPQDERAESFLRELVSRPSWNGFKYQLVEALLEGFDSRSVRQEIEAGIVDQAQPIHQRAAMLVAYHRTKPDDSKIAQFAKQIFENNAEAELRSNALMAIGGFGPNSLKALEKIAIDDKDHQVRSAALSLIRQRMRDPLSFLIERAASDNSGKVRASAVRQIDELGYDNHEWFCKLFQSESSDDVRIVILFWLLKKESVIGENEFRSLLEGEIQRADPSYAASLSANIAMERWPADKAIFDLVTDMLKKLPENTGGWNTSLPIKLREFGKRVGQREAG